MGKKSWFLKKLNKYQAVIALCMLAVFLIAIGGITYSWLTYEDDDGTESPIGSVGVEIYNGSTKINGAVTANPDYDPEDPSSMQYIYTQGAPVEVTLGAVDVPVTLDLKIANTGTIAGILRVGFYMYIKPEDPDSDMLEIPFINQVAVTSSETEGWAIYQPNDLYSDMHFYSTFLKRKLNGALPLETKDTANLVSSVAASTDALANKTIVIEVRAEIVAYSGNAYQVNAAAANRPWQLSNDFLNNVWTVWQ